MIKFLSRAMMMALCFAVAAIGSHAAEQVVATYSDAVVWANPPAVASGSAETVTPQIAGAAAVQPVMALKVDIATAGKGILDVQTLSKPFSLTNGQRYTLSFFARSDKPHQVQVTTRINLPDWHAVCPGDPNIVIGTDWHHYTSTFTAANVGNGDNVVAFALGDQAGSTWIADLTLTTNGPVAAQKSELPAAPVFAPVPKNAYRVLFIGNSITQHQFNSETVAGLGWDHLSGMAASAQNSDYVHLLIAKIQTLMPGRPVAIRITSLVPGGLGTTAERLAPVVADSAGFNPDLVVFQHGEHELGTRGVDSITETYNAVLDLFTKSARPPHIVCVGNWSLGFDAAGADYADWAATVEHTMQDVCAKRGVPFVSVAAIAADPLSHGAGTSPGVQWHPNDRAHAKYADAIFEVVRPMIGKNVHKSSSAVRLSQKASR